MLLIADIGGYTHYMHWNRLHLAHAQQTVAGLLEAVIDAGKGLKPPALSHDGPAHSRYGFDEHGLRGGEVQPHVPRTAGPEHVPGAECYAGMVE